jgi:hypothetical protein
MPGINHNLKLFPVEYTAWYNMKTRCKRESYIKKGIGIDDQRWLKFSNFIQDMGLRPGLKYTLERIDDSKGYSKSNCKWATRIEQNQNRPLYNKLTKQDIDDIRRTYKAGIYSQKELANLYDTSQQYISLIINYKIWI